MFSLLRGKWGSIIFGSIIGFIALVFVFQGVFSPKATRGLHEASVAGVVNSDRITLQEFNQAFNRRAEFIKNLAGGTLSEEQLKQFRVRESTFHELVQQRLIIHDAHTKGLEPSDEAIRNEISKLPYFQKDGKFDTITYKQTLQANNYTAGQFEKMIREQLLVEEWVKQFDREVQVSETELKEEFESNGTQRNVKFVAIPAASEKKGKLSPKETAEQAVALLKSDKKSDAKLNELLKPYGVVVRESGLIGKNIGMIPGIGDDAKVLGAVFGTDPAIKTKPQIFETTGAIIVALVKEEKNPDWKKFDAEKTKLSEQVAGKKKRFLQDSAMKKLIDDAHIDPNPDVVGEYVKKDVAGI